MTPEELNELVLKVFGARGTKAYTSALGVLSKYPEVLIGAIQGSPFTHKVKGYTDVRDARKAVDTKLNMGEWTAYHAEMIIVSALLNYLEIDIVKLDFATVKRKLADGAGNIVITADAPCCKHCGNMLDALGIKYHGTKGAAGLTGWWNPITDKVAANGSAEFKKDLPNS